MKMNNFYALFNTFLCIGIDISIGRLCNCHIGIGIGIGRYEKMLIGRPLALTHIGNYVVMPNIFCKEIVF